MLETKNAKSAFMVVRFVAHGLIAIIATIGGVFSAIGSESVPLGEYLCRVDKSVGVRGQHMEGEQSLRTFEKETATRFKIQIVMNHAKKYVLEEVAYEGQDRDRTQWHTEDSVLHGTYVGDGFDYRSDSDLAFLRFGSVASEGRVTFLHSGFEYPGGEDVSLTVRFGTCRPAE